MVVSFMYLHLRNIIKLNDTIPNKGNRNDGALIECDKSCVRDPESRMCPSGVRLVYSQTGLVQRRHHHLVEM